MGGEERDRKIEKRGKKGEKLKEATPLLSFWCFT